VASNDFVVDSAYKGYIFSEIQESEDEKIYKFSNETGSGQMNCISLIDGIQISYNNLNMYSTHQKIISKHDVLQIDYCLDGCYGFKLKNNEYAFFGKGDFSILDLGKANFESSCMPTNKYIGISIFIDVEKANESLKEYFSFTHIDLRKIRERLCKDIPVLIFRSRQEINHIMLELYNVKSEIRIPYSIIKTIELLLFLSVVEVKDYREITLFSEPIYEATQSCYISILKNPFDRKSIAELSKVYGISESSLKRCFLYITGETIGAFMRNACLDAAAELMINKPNITVGEVSEIAGYANWSKFSKAFKIRYEVSPQEFKKKNLN